jgi:hypothetical protein
MCPIFSTFSYSLVNESNEREAERAQCHHKRAGGGVGDVVVKPEERDHLVIGGVRVDTYRQDKSLQLQ